MGNYLEKPNISFKSQNSTIFGHKYVVGEIQGWKLQMENFYSVHTDKNCLVVGLYNGHGGKEISRYLQINFISLLINNQNYKSQKYYDAILQTYKQIDKNISQYKREIIKLRHPDDNRNPERNEFFDQDLEYCGSSCLVIILTKDKDFCGEELSNIKDILDYQEKNKKMNCHLKINQCFGNLELKDSEIMKINMTPHIKHTKVNKDQFIIFGCSGVFQQQNQQQVIQKTYQLLQQEKQQKTVIEKLLNYLIAKDCKTLQSGLENMTAGLVILK